MNNYKMDYNFSKNQLQEFLQNPVWLFLKKEVREAVEDGRNMLEKVTPTDVAEIASIQGGLARLREFITKPDDYLEELKEEESLKNAN